MSERATTYIEVVLKVDHDADVDDDALSAACEKFAGDTLIEGERGWNAQTRETTVKLDALIEDVETVWVKGSTP